MGNVMKGIHAMRFDNWKRYAQDRNKWKSVVELAKTYKDFYAWKNERSCMGNVQIMPMLNTTKLKSE
jgi:hypothetical protein